jgi:hypothetical protein
MTFVSNFRQALLGVGLILVGWPLYFLFRYIERDRPQRMDHQGSS